MSISSNAVITDVDYEIWRAGIKETFTFRAETEQLYRTDAPALFELYLSLMPEENRQYYNCNACKDFLTRFGGLVTIDKDGRTTPAMWDVDDAPLSLRTLAGELVKRVGRAKVTGVFITSEAVLGRPITGKWTHLAAELPKEKVYKGKAYTPGQLEAEKLEDYKLISRNVGAFRPEIVAKTLQLLRSETLVGGEKVLGPIQWLSDLQVAIKEYRNQRSNLIWRAVGTAPAGFAHFSTGLAGMLLTDIGDGKDFHEVTRSMRAKTNPLTYQRPTEAPNAGAIEAAEKVVEKMGIARSLERRFAKLEEIETIWLPTIIEPAPASGKVFGHLVPRDQIEVAALETPVVSITWDKFQRTVLKDAKKLEYEIPYGVCNYVALVTATNMDAPPIIFWDKEDCRNPVSWYVYDKGSPASKWGLPRSGYCPITAVTLLPPMWNGGEAFQFSNGVILLLEGARDLEPPSLALFPNTLRSELHGIRSTIEHFSKKGKVAGAEEATACGLLLGNGGWGGVVRVNGSNRYKLDRWD